MNTPNSEPTLSASPVEADGQNLPSSAGPTDPPRDRGAWFADARFGMFIHWGLYAVLGRGEWAMSREYIPMEEYEPLKDRFTAEHYDPHAWAALARDAGMKYAVLTTKHHEGFCLWDSKVCSFNATRSAAGRDLVGEYVEAFREAGLKVGLYYSLGDWLNPDWRRGYEPGPEREPARERFMGYTKELLRELLTGYGPIDLLFYDLPQNYSAQEWDAVGLNAMARRLHPNILINNRAMTTEDYATPEQHATASPPGRMWETCMTLNDNWGYVPSDHHFKTPREIVRTLTQIASGAGNLLLNVGPDAQGRIPAESQSILREVGGWLAEHGESVYGSQRHGMSWNMWGGCTARGRVLYLHLSRYFGSTLTIGALVPRVLKAELIGSPLTLTVEQTSERVVIHGLPETAPNPLMPVLRLELDAPPEQDFRSQLGIADIFPVFPA